jgi:hypothetical protein
MGWTEGDWIDLGLGWGVGQGGGNAIGGEGMYVYV